MEFGSGKDTFLPLLRATYPNERPTAFLAIKRKIQEKISRLSAEDQIFYTEAIVGLLNGEMGEIPPFDSLLSSIDELLQDTVPVQLSAPTATPPPPQSTAAVKKATPNTQSASSSAQPKPNNNTSKNPNNRTGKAPQFHARPAERPSEPSRVPNITQSAGSSPNLAQPASPPSKQKKEGKFSRPQPESQAPRSSQSAPRTSYQSQSPSTSSNNPHRSPHIGKQRPFLDRFIDGEIPLSDIDERSAIVLIEKICSFEDILGMCYKLDPPNEKRETFTRNFKFVFAVSDSHDFLCKGVVSFLQWLGKDELSRGTLRRVRAKLIELVASIPQFLQTLSDFGLSGDATPKEIVPIVWFFEAVLMLPGRLDDSRCTEPIAAFVEVISQRQLSPLISSIALKIKAILNPEKDIIASPNASNESFSISDHQAMSPGWRHDNDKVNYREIEAIPTPDEVLSNETPFIPTAGDESPLLERMFRLFRQDMILSLRSNLELLPPTLDPKSNTPASQKWKSWILKNVIPLGFGFSFNGQQSFRFKFKFNNESLPKKFWTEGAGKKRMSPGTLVHFATADDLKTPLLIGIIQWVDEDEISSKDPSFGLRFSSDQWLRRGIRLMASPPDNLVIVLHRIAVFGIEPVLKRLQNMVGIPFVEEFGRFNSTPTPSEIAPRFKDLRQSYEDPSSKLNKEASLDEGQRLAMVHSLFLRVTLVQGPPGTGKSFIGIHLAHKLLTSGVPLKILCVTYTNHALEDLLEGLVKKGITNIVRIGKTSKNPTIQQFNLNEKKKNMVNVKSALFDRRYGVLKRSLETAQNDLLEAQSPLLGERSLSVKPEKRWDTFRLYLQEIGSPFLQELTYVVDYSRGGFRTVGAGGKALEEDALWVRWSTGQRHLNENLRHPENSCWNLSFDERKNFIMAWEDDMFQSSAEAMLSCAKAYSTLMSDLDDLYRSKEYEIINSAQVIMCTTSGAAKYFELISEAQCDVILVEEAAEILEPHLLSSLFEKTKSVVMIGDHKQLRPKVENYDMQFESGKGYNLNVSLFERLILQGYPYVTLQNQHRMHPDISHYIRGIYPDLRDASSVSSRPLVLGMSGRVAFINHTTFENGDPSVVQGGDVSYCNVFEAEFAVGLVNYFLQQGYDESQIVVLTPYLGQLRLISQHLKKAVISGKDLQELDDSSIKTKPGGVRVAAVDNYQGEENDIIIVSLVRGNPARRIGFVGLENRVNVLLSRARNGMIVLGHGDTLENCNSAQGRQLWSTILNKFREKNCFFNHFPALCRNHGRPTKIYTGADFEKLCQLGGCDHACGEELSCGHKCVAKCHPRDRDHKNIKCGILVKRECPQNHYWSYKCGAEPIEVCQRCAKLEDQRRKEMERFEAQRAKRQAERDEIELKIAREKVFTEEAHEQTEHLRFVQAKSAELNRLEIANRPKGSPTASAPQSSAQAAPSIANPQATSPKARENLSKFEIEDEEIRNEWAVVKGRFFLESEAMDKLVKMASLRPLKRRVLDTIYAVGFARQNGSDPKKIGFNLRFEGNPGTGKTTAGELYAKVLLDLGIFGSLSGSSENSNFVETSGAELSQKGADQVQKFLDSIAKAGGGVLFVDEAYMLEPQSMIGLGRQALNLLMTEMEKRRGSLVVIFAGYKGNMETLFQYNDGLRSRFSETVVFEDYEEQELLLIFEKLMVDEGGKYPFLFEQSPGQEDPKFWGRVAIRRLAAGRNFPGFANGRSVRKLFESVRRRLVDRWKANQKLDAFGFSKSDFLGTSAVESVKQSLAWKELMAMTGLQKIKDSLIGLLELVKTNEIREQSMLPRLNVALNRVFLGNPGTGKTTAAGFYGKILKDFGLLSKGDLVSKSASDFVGNVLGESQSKTRAILKEAEGSVLVIDEAYGLSGDDPYKASVIDTIVEQVQGFPGEDRCVILLGYRDQMEKMLKESNPGLQRRFQLENAFHFDDYSDEELVSILKQKLAKQSLEADEDAIKAALENLAYQRATNPPFGNGGSVANLLSTAIGRMNARKAGASGKLLRKDFEDPNRKASISDEDIFTGLIGCGSVVDALQNIKATLQRAKERGVESKNVSKYFRFVGDPGTGKTTVARRIGLMFNSLGILASSQVVEVSGSDLVATFVGQTAPKTRGVLDKALGRVLFIDEAYSLEGNQFGQEAIDELVKCMTEPRYMGNLVIIIAGYKNAIDQLLLTNEGLRSRFDTEMVFNSFGVDDCLKLLAIYMKEPSVGLAFDASAQKKLPSLLQTLVSTPGFANGRDLRNLVKYLENRVARSIKSGFSKVDSVSEDDLNFAINELLRSMKRPDPILSSGLNSLVPPPVAVANPSPINGEMSTKSAQATATPVALPVAFDNNSDGPDDTNVDFSGWGLSDEDLEALKKAAKLHGHTLYCQLNSPDSPEFMKHLKTTLGKSELETKLLVVEFYGKMEAREEAERVKALKVKERILEIEAEEARIKGVKEAREKKEQDEELAVMEAERRAGLAVEDRQKRKEDRENAKIQRELDRERREQERQLRELERQLRAEQRAAERAARAANAYRCG